MALGPGSIALIVTAGLIVFGPKKLPDLGRSVGETLREFKKATSGMLSDEEKIASKQTYQLKRNSTKKTAHYVVKKSENHDLKQ
ncbi:sec-independent protein translocase TatA [Enterococcus sp. DIV2402]|uniref:Sec-independent protein translocase protein TatA n=1 Tax=Candidatus Enterococcus lowellii TaxID=2230877 RepID=A0ABZ2SQ10_9ENTE|nr:twin-arginine translocase TatA/TatE family subunit [Enterococcus sp. DIV2402]MBO0463379.1 twin-arginine translocase TatA/TatE family subunit [Enterococcus sp. DIV2402]